MTIEFTREQLFAIAAETQDCHPEGLGTVVNVFSDGSTLQGISENDATARGDGAGGWDHRIACLRTPMEPQEVEEYLEQIQS